MLSIGLVALALLAAGRDCVSAPRRVPTTHRLILTLRPTASFDNVLNAISPWLDPSFTRKYSIGRFKALAVSISDPTASVTTSSSSSSPPLGPKTLPWLTSLVSQSVDAIELDARVSVSLPAHVPPPLLQAPATTTRPSHTLQIANADAPTCTQSPAGHWGLARIDQPKPSADDQYVYACPAADEPGVNRATIYLIDTGIFVDHDEFRGGRASWGTNFVPESPDEDEHGHGTFTAGMAAGLTYGVAKAESVHLIAVKALDKDGGGPISQVIDALQWVATDHARHDGQARNVTVCNLSLGGIRSRSLNRAVSATAESGVIVTVAAGNEGLDACLTSPSSSSDAITVGATTPDDRLAEFRNTGTCIDILAPGQNLKSAWIGSRDATMPNMNGTSFASPMVAGAIAQYAALGKVNRDMDVGQVKEVLAKMAVEDEISIQRGFWGWISRTPNLLVQV